MFGGELPQLPNFENPEWQTMKVENGLEEVVIGLFPNKFKIDHNLQKAQALL